MRTSSDDIHSPLNKIGTPLAFVEPLKLLMQQPFLLEEMAPDKHLLSMITASQTDTWFTTKGQPKIALASAGCGVGDPLADLLCNLAILPALNKIETSLKRNHMPIRWPQRPVRPFWSVCSDLHQDANKGFDQSLHPTFTAFVDDLATLAPLDISVTNDIRSNLAELPTLVSNVLMERGMVINTKRGKSALVVCVAGPNTHQAKQILAETATIDAAGLRFFVESSYTHVGGVIDNGASMGPEMSNRAISVRALSNPVRSHITGKASLTVEQHATVIDALVLSSFCHNSHTWCDMT